MTVVRPAYFGSFSSLFPWRKSLDTPAAVLYKSPHRLFLLLQDHMRAVVQYNSTDLYLYGKLLGIRGDVAAYFPFASSRDG